MDEQLKSTPAPQGVVGEKKENDLEKNHLVKGGEATSKLAEFAKENTKVSPSQEQVKVETADLSQGVRPEEPVNTDFTPEVPKQPTAKVTPQVTKSEKKEKEKETLVDSKDKEVNPGRDGIQPGPLGNIDPAPDVQEYPAPEEPMEEKHFKIEADGILRGAAKSIEMCTCSHRAATIAINSPGVVFDVETKVLSYKGGKTKLVIIQ